MSVYPFVATPHDKQCSDMIITYLGLTDFVGVDSRTSQLVLFSNQADHAETGFLAIRKALLRDHSSFNIATNLVDAHLYIFARVCSLIL